MNFMNCIASTSKARRSQGSSKNAHPALLEKLTNTKLNLFNPAKVEKDAQKGINTILYTGKNPKHLYILERHLQKSNFGQIYRAGEYSLGRCMIEKIRLVAIKIMFLPPGTNELKVHSAEVCFKDRMQGHQNVLVIDHYWIEQSVMFIVMPFAELEDLCEVMSARRNPFSESDSRWIFSQILSGALFLHKQGLAFRDHSLENILIFYDDANNCIVPKIADPGQAVEILYDAKGQVKEIRNRPFGKLSRPPEAYDEKNAYDPAKVDVFCLGYILFFMVTKNQPFRVARRSDPDWLCLLQRDFNTFFKRRKATHLSKEVQHLLVHMLEPNYKKRYTLEKCKEHPWFSKSMTSVDKYHLLEMKPEKPMSIASRGSDFSISYESQPFGTELLHRYSNEQIPFPASPEARRDTIFRQNLDKIVSKQDSTSYPLSTETVETPSEEQGVNFPGYMVPPVHRKTIRDPKKPDFGIPQSPDDSRRSMYHSLCRKPSCVIKTVVENEEVITSQATKNCAVPDDARQHYLTSLNPLFDKKSASAEHRASIPSANRSYSLNKYYPQSMSSMPLNQKLAGAINMKPRASVSGFESLIPEIYPKANVVSTRSIPQISGTNFTRRQDLNLKTLPNSLPNACRLGSDDHLMKKDVLKPVYPDAQAISSVVYKQNISKPHLQFNHNMNEIANQTIAYDYLPTVVLKEEINEISDCSGRELISELSASAEMLEEENTDMHKKSDLHRHKKLDPQEQFNAHTSSTSRSKKITESEKSSQSKVKSNNYKQRDMEYDERIQSSQNTRHQDLKKPISEDPKYRKASRNNEQNTSSVNNYSREYSKNKTELKSKTRPTDRVSQSKEDIRQAIRNSMERLSDRSDSTESKIMVSRPETKLQQYTESKKNGTAKRRESQQESRKSPYRNENKTSDLFDNSGRVNLEVCAIERSDSIRKNIRRDKERLRKDVPLGSVENSIRDSGQDRDPRGYWKKKESPDEEHRKLSKQRGKQQSNPMSIGQNGTHPIDPELRYNPNNDSDAPSEEINITGSSHFEGLDSFSSTTSVSQQFYYQLDTENDQTNTVNPKEKQKNKTGRSPSKQFQFVLTSDEEKDNYNF